MRALARNPLIFLWRTMWRHAEGRRRQVVTYIVMSSAAMVLFLMYPLLIARLLNCFQLYSGTELIEAVTFYLALYFAIDVVFWALHGPSRVMESNVAFQVKLRFQDRLFRRVTLLPMRWHRDHHSGETIDQVAKATTAIGDFTANSFIVIQMLTRFFGALIILTTFMPWAGLAVACITVIVVTSTLLFDRVLTAQYKQLNKKYNEVAAAVQDYLTNIGTVISLRLEGRVAREVVERLGRIFPLYRKNTRLNELKWFTASMLVSGTQAGVLMGYCIITVKSGEPVLAGTVFALYEYLRSIGEAFFNFTWKYGDLVVQTARLIGVEHVDESFEKEVSASADATLPEGWQRIEIRGLTFSHNGEQDRSHISDVSMSFERGKSYAFVGESGSGKSTVLGLIRGIHQGQATVAVDGSCMPYGLAHVSHKTTLIPQDPEIFSESIRFNVTMGIDASAEAVDRAIKLARFDSVVERLPRGLETSIAEKGVSLSGGEKQRLALARGFFFVEESGSEIVLLDEPTSSVDLYNERVIYEKALALNKDRVVVSSIHKFHLLHLFDEVVVFAGGKVVERGTAAELLAVRGELHRLWAHFSMGEAA